MQGRRSELPRMQSDFYRYRFRKTLHWLLASVVVIFILIAAIIYVIFSRTEPMYYANTTDGRIFDMPGQG